MAGGVGFALSRLARVPFRTNRRRRSSRQSVSPISSGASSTYSRYRDESPDSRPTDDRSRRLSLLATEDTAGVSPHSCYNDASTADAHASINAASSEDGSWYNGLDPEAYPDPPKFLLKRASRRRCYCCAMFLLILLVLAAGVVAYLWRAEAAIQLPWMPDRDTLDFAKKPLPPPNERLRIKNFELPLRTKGRHVVDQAGRRFKLASINWYGASDELYVPGGLDVQHRSKICDTIKRMGFNSVRLPYADEIVMSNPVVDPKVVSKNPDLVGLRVLDVYEAVVKALTDAGIAVIVNNHITSATWCCGADPCDAGWANDHLGPLCRVRQTEEQWIDNWETVMSRFVDDPLVIGADLRNEVRGLWGTMPWSKWAAAAERCGNRLLAMKPDWLIVVEGTESANDVSGAALRPVRLDVAHRLVYSAHIYAWSGWGDVDGRFKQRPYASFARTMRRNWSYLLEGDVAPVWVGELGASDSPSVGEANYWNNMWRLLKELDADFGYWALNPRKPHGNVRETYSLVEDDWVTPMVDYRMKDMSELMSQ